MGLVQGASVGNDPLWHGLGLSLTLIIYSTFVGIMYGQLATWLGIGRKWMLTSCAVLGIMAMATEAGTNGGMGWHTVMLLTQFAAPLATGWWFTKRIRLAGRVCIFGTKVLAFGVSPVVALTILWFVLGSPILTIASLIAGLIAGLLTPLVAVGITPDTLAVVYYGMNLLMLVIPTAVASLLYCKLTKGIGSGRTWMVVSCAVLACSAAIGCFRLATFLVSLSGQHLGWPFVLTSLPFGLTMCISLAHFVVPLAIGWWFLRRKHDQGPVATGDAGHGSHGEPILA
jgi:hypothetical protein